MQLFFIVLLCLSNEKIFRLLLVIYLQKAVKWNSSTFCFFYLYSCVNIRLRQRTIQQFVLQLTIIIFENFIPSLR